MDLKSVKYLKQLNLKQNLRSSSLDTVNIGQWSNRSASRIDHCFSQYIWITYFSVKRDEGVSTKDLNEDLNRTKMDFFN